MNIDCVQVFQCGSYHFLFLFQTVIFFRLKLSQLKLNVYKTL